MPGAGIEDGESGPKTQKLMRRGQTDERTLHTSPSRREQCGPSHRGQRSVRNRLDANVRAGGGMQRDIIVCCFMSHLGMQSNNRNYPLLRCNTLHQ